MTDESKRKIFFITLGILTLILISWLVCYRVKTIGPGIEIFPLSIICMIAGMLFEGRRIFQGWGKMLGVILFAVIMTLIMFLIAGINQVEIADHHFSVLPFVFMLSFAIGCVSMHEERVNTSLTEGIALLQSIAITYWVLDKHIYETPSLFIRVIMLIGILFALFTFVHAFTHLTLSRTNRLLLSIWSSIIIVVLAVDNFYQYYLMEPIEQSADLNTGIITGLQFFLLGASLIYFVQNYILLASFIPGRGSFFNAEYFRAVRESKESHIKRYSEDQVSIFHSLLCIIISGGLFYLNFKYKLVPRQSAIWIVFIIFPYFLFLLELFTMPFSSRK